MPYDSWKLRAPEDAQGPHDRPSTPTRRGNGVDRRLNGPCIRCARQKVIAVSMHPLIPLCRKCYESDKLQEAALAMVEQLDQA